MIDRHRTLLESLPSLASRIQGARSTNEIVGYIAATTSELGLHGMVFTSHTGSGWAGSESDSYRYLAACPPAWCQTYTANKWYINDPCLLYAQTTSEVCLLSSIEARSKGQENMLAAAQSSGFASGLVIPAHGPRGRSRMGVLYVYSSDPTHFAGSIDPTEGMLYKALALGLLEWFAVQERQRLLTGSAFSKHDFDFMRLVHLGHGSKEISDALGVSKEAVDKRCSRIARRLGAQNRKAAADLLHAIGAL